MGEGISSPPPAQPRHPALNLARQIAGWFFVALAIFGLLIPVIPHTPFLALGAILLAPYIRIFRRISAWVHKRFPRLRPHMRPFRIFKRPLRGPPSAGQNPRRAG